MYEILLVHLDDGPARNLVYEYYAANLLAANKFLPAFEALQVAAELPCVKALVVPTTVEAGDPALEIELKEMYMRLFDEKFSLNLKNPRIVRKYVSPEQMRDTYITLALPLSRKICEEVGDTRDCHFQDDLLIPGATVWQLQANSPDGPIEVHRAGYIVRIKLPDGNVIEQKMGEAVGHQLAEW